MAKIVELMPGSDGKIRTAKLKCGGRYWIRATNMLYPLEISQEREVEMETRDYKIKESFEDIHQERLKIYIKNYVLRNFLVFLRR